MDLATIIGLVMGFGAIFGGAVIEGVHIKALIQPTAAMIVLGGTFGAVFVSFPLPLVIKAFKDVKIAVLPPNIDHDAVVKDIINYATKARRNGLISLEQEAQTAKDPFIKKGISLVVDGIDPQKLRETLEADILAYEDHTKHSVEFYEAAGGYSPTIGIIGAVLGLIHVMSNLSDTSKLGGGIAVAFVATIYGLMVANIVCLPIGSKIKIRMKEEVLRRVMILEGLIAIQNGENPHFIEQKLKAFAGGH
ncbi:MAG: flagellar motor protein MotA [Desulfuromonadales bacterium GWD2_54_10]|nr:MAG: flagellar motor protein MotA [Desulfuromonadales bacterium GWD2_54_10]